MTGFVDLSGFLLCLQLAHDELEYPSKEELVEALKICDSKTKLDYFHHAHN